MEQYRGEINGVQNGLNSVMDTIKFALVMGLPDIQSFGFLIITSVSALTFGGLFYTSYFYTTRNSKSNFSSDFSEKDDQVKKLRPPDVKSTASYGTI